MSDEKPVLRVVRGEPTPEELAVVTALVSAAAGGSASAAPPLRRGRWNDPMWGCRRPLWTGPGAWRASAR